MTPITPDPLALMLTALPRLDSAQRERLIYQACATLAPDVLTRIRTHLTERVKYAFKIGDLVEFDTRDRRGVVRIRIDRINDKSVSGKQIGGLRPGVNWRVAPTFLRPVVAEATAKPVGLPDLRHAPIGPAARLPRELQPDFGSF